MIQYDTVSNNKIEKQRNPTILFFKDDNIK